jgi:hypothetical protein
VGGPGGEREDDEGREVEYGQEAGQEVHARLEEAHHPAHQPPLGMGGSERAQETEGEELIAAMTERTRPGVGCGVWRRV